MLNLQRVTKTHWVGPYEKRTLAGVTLTVAAGEFIGVWGAPRTGKSTLLRISAGLETPDSGTVSVDGLELGRLSKSRLGTLRLDAVGLVAGHGPHSGRMTVADFVALPLLRRYAHAEARKRALTTLNSVDILACRNATWNQLSDSERALASLAHGLVRRPRLLLVDDLTRGLDAPQQAEMVRLLRRSAAEDAVAILMTVSSMNALVGTHGAYRLSDGSTAPIASAAADIIDFPTGQPSA